MVKWIHYSILTLEQTNSKICRKIVFWPFPETKVSKMYAVAATRMYACGGGPTEIKYVYM